MKSKSAIVLSLLITLSLVVCAPFSNIVSNAETEDQTQKQQEQQQEPQQEEPQQEEPVVEPVQEPEQPQYPVYSPNATQIPVLTYHMVVSDKQKKKGKYRRSSLAVGQSQFDQQLAYLASKGYKTITCEEFYKWYIGEITLPVKSVLITFDDGAKGVADYGLPVLVKYNMTGTVFIVGSRTIKNKKNTIGYDYMHYIQQNYPNNMEFQSHTFNLHKKFKKNIYATCMNDAAVQRAYFPEFEYLAYPYGTNKAAMRQAYADSGIKMAFTYGKNGYANRSQNIYQIRRIKVDGRKSLKKFAKWV